MAKFLNHLLISIVGFFLTFLWLSYCKQELWVRYVLSLLFAIMLFLILRTLLKTTNALPYKHNKKNLQALKYTLAFMSEYKIFTNCFEAQKMTCKAVTETFWVAEGEEKILLNFVFRLSNIGPQDLINAYKQSAKLGIKKIIIFCISVEPSLWRWQNNFPAKITILDFNGCMDFLKRNDKRLVPLKLQKKQKFFDKSFFYFAFSKNRFKHYLVISLILIVTSFISFFPLYDMIMATICLIASVYSLVNKRFNPQFYLPVS